MQEITATPTVPVVQHDLLTDIPLAKAYPNRALSKIEMFLVVAIRYRIQKELQDHGSVTSDPLVFDINISDLANECDQKNVSMFKMSIANSVRTLGNRIPTENIPYIDSAGKKKVYILPLVMGIDISETGQVTVKVNPDYQKYYVNYVLQNPDIKFKKRFFLKMNSKYSYPLSNWLVAKIAEARKAGQYSKDYRIIAPFEEVKQKVPPASEKMTNANYLIKVIKNAVDDINSNPYANMTITNTNFVNKRERMKVVELCFDVKITLSESDSLFIPHPDFSLIDDDDTPSWEYIEMKLRSQLNVNSSYIATVKKGPRKYAWLIYLYTVTKNQNARYFNKVYKSYQGNDTIKSLASTLRFVNPELCDDVIDSILMKDIVSKPMLVEKWQEEQPTKAPSPIADFLQGVKKRRVSN